MINNGYLKYPNNGGIVRENDTSFFMFNENIFRNMSNIIDKIQVSGVTYDIGGSGGGKTVVGGTNISVTTGETADTINCTLNLVNGGGTNSVKMKNTHSSNGTNSFSIGSDGVKASGLGSFAGGSYSEANGIFSMAFGRYSKANNYGEAAFGFFGISNGSSSAAGNGSGNTLFSVGNGTNGYGGQHNAFEIRQNGDIYITLNDQDVKLQDQLGGGSSYTAGDGIDITNDVISVTGKADTSAVTEVSDALTAHTADTTVHTTAAEKTSWNSAATNASNAVTALGGLSLVKLTQAEYDALSPNYDSNTLYVIVN